MTDSSHSSAPVAISVAQLTLRSLVTGMVLGAILSLCNIYSGLKIGWGTNMSITAALLAYAFWQLGQTIGRSKPYGIIENTVSQTGASAGASISSAGLVAPIPALTMLTGQTLAWHWLSIWVFSVACVGIAVGVGLRRQMLVVDKLPFPYGIATAETLREMYARGAEAMARVKALLGAAGFAAALKVAEELLKLPKLGLPGSLALTSPALAGKGIGAASLKNLGFALEPSVLMVGVGGLIGMRACASLLLGALVSWGLLAPWLLERGWASPGKPGASEIWFGTLVNWMLWPGVVMMVTASLTSFAFSGRSIARALFGRGRDAGDARSGEPNGYEFSRRSYWTALGGVLVVSVVLQFWLFGIGWHVALFGVIITFVLAIVAGRVSGETGITPVGAMGKVTQLSFGVVAPGDPTSNLMAANVTGGAASQCADMLHDLRTGVALGAWPRPQALAQLGGVLAGALAGSAAYLILVPDPKNMLLTSDWPAPAVAQWKAVAEVFQKGFDTMPEGSIPAMLIAGAIGIVCAVLEKTLPARMRTWVPSASSVGLALVIPAYYSLHIFIGGVIAVVAARFVRSWSERFLVVAASGLIAGESLAGVAFAVKKML